MDFFSQVCGTDEGAFQHLKDDVSVVLVHGGQEVLPASKYFAYCGSFLIHILMDHNIFSFFDSGCGIASKSIGLTDFSGR